MPVSLHGGEDGLVDVGAARLEELLDARRDARHRFDAAVVAAGISDVEGIIDGIEDFLNRTA